MPSTVVWHLSTPCQRLGHSEDIIMLGSDNAILGAIAILIIGIVVSVVLIG
jgi:hypothetical protein